jgi:uncharacterized BrkB/YihY/UPF0761 family membrane protein
VPESDDHAARPGEPGAPGAPPGRVARARATVEHGRSRAEAAFRRLESARRTSTVVDAGFDIYDRDNTAGGPVLAGALAFRLFVFVVPYVFVLLTIAGSAANLQQKSAGDVARDAGLTGIIAKSIADTKRQSDGVQIASLVVGTYALYLAARSVVKTTRAVHALAWRVRLRRLKRSWRGAVLLIGVVVATSAFAQGANALRGEGILAAVWVTILTCVIWGGAWLGLSLLLPRDPRAPWTALIPGALLFGIVVSLMHFVTVVYFSRKLSSASDTYGAIGAAIAILLALYLIGRAIAASAVLNATIWERKQQDRAAAGAPAAG